MAKKVSRFKLKESDRSGFEYREVELIKDGSYQVGGDEFDSPPPSKQPLGGEGELSGNIRPNSSFTVANLATPSGYDHPTFYITAAGGIAPNFDHSPMYVTGSNDAITISSNPRISVGRQSQILTLFCVDSTITLNHGNSLNLIGSSNIVLSSGAYVTFIYSTANTAWNETSRGKVN